MSEPQSSRPGSHADSFSLFPRKVDDPLRHGYEKKVAIHAGMGGVPVARADLDRVFAGMTALPRKGKATAYVHTPFCESRCVYCGFFRLSYREEYSAPFVDALISELAQDADSAAVRSGPIQALYFGGGTPTCLAATDLERLIRAARTYLPLANDCEITVEGRIFHFDEEKMEACLGGGANRFSLGVQTFDTGLRQALGRVSDKEEVIRSLTRLRDMDSASVVIDLIFGLPGQTLDDWEWEVRTFLSLALDGVDLYQLNVHPHSLLERRLRENSIAPVAGVPEQAEMFARGVEIMEQAGARRLSNAHWGTSLRERNIYNVYSKSRFDCLAYGPGAGGMLHGHGYFIEPDYSAYMKARLCSRKPVAHIVMPPPYMDIARAVIPQMEQGYLHLGQVEKSTGIAARTLFAPLVRRYVECGMMQRKEELAVLTPAGQFWHVNLTQGLIEWYLNTIRGGVEHA
jgi:oxygen-independent coproporphyrinogen-3 oxidase